MECEINFIMDLFLHNFDYNIPYIAILVIRFWAYSSTYAIHAFLLLNAIVLTLVVFGIQSYYEKQEAT